jgi:hypothetical protein
LRLPKIGRASTCRRESATAALAHGFTFTIRAVHDASPSAKMRINSENQYAFEEMGALASDGMGG